MMKTITIYIPILLMLLSACNQEEKLPTVKGAPLELEITAEDLLAADQAQTRITEGGTGGYTTSFSDGDQIGITVVKGGNIVDGMDNVPFTYNQSTGKWTAASGKNLFFYDDAQYIAYYPHSTDMNGKKTIDEIVEAFTPKEDQSDFATGYSKSCLMTATGTANATTKKLQLTFAHQMAMLELQFKQTLNGVEAAVMADAGSTLNVTSGGKNYTFNTQSTDKRYRMMLKPGTTVNLDFDYFIDGVHYTHSATNLTMPAAGKYLHYDLNHRQTQVTMILNTGNYEGALGDVSKIVMNGTSRTATKESSNTYEVKISVPYGTNIPSSVSSMDIYINDNLANTECLLVSPPAANVNLDSSAGTISVTLSKGGMEGAGTSEGDPYLVTTAAQLRGVGQSTAAQYKQTKNIDLSIYSNWPSVNYSGTYDGGHNKISNLTCTSGSGLFNEVSGKIKNAHIASGSVTRNGTAGGFCGNLTATGTIENCSNAATITGTVKGSGFFGGICGETHGKVLHCKNTGTISGKGEIFGGVVGWVNTGTLQYSYNAGKVEPDEPYHNSKPGGVGGVAGATYYGTYYLTYCYNIGTVKDYGDKEVASGGGAGTVQKGEIVGWTDNGQRVQYNWYKDGTKASGDGKIDTTNKKFNSPSDWPTYSAGTGDGWTSTHWKSFGNGEYPKLLWE